MFLVRDNFQRCDVLVFLNRGVNVGEVETLGGEG